MDPEESPAHTPPPTYFPGGQRLAFFTLLIAILVLAWMVVRPFIVAIVLAAAVTALSHWIYERLSRAAGGRPRLSAALMLIGVLVGVLGPIGTLIGFGAAKLVNEVQALVPRLPEAQGFLLRLADRLGSLGGPLRRAAESIGATIADLAPRVAKSVSPWLGVAGEALVNISISLFLFGISVYYFYLNGVAWRERLIRLLPIEQRYARSFLARFREVSIAVLVGNLGTAVVHGIISGLGYWVLGVEAPFLWGVATAFASFIPLFGTALVWLPLSIALAISESWVRGLLLAGYGAVVVGLSDNVARPLLMERRLGVHPLFVFIAVFGGLASFGVSGLFVGPLVMALTVAALDIYDADREPSSIILTDGPSTGK